MQHQPINTIIAKQAVEEQGYQVRGIESINEGSNHYVFLLNLADGRKVICKFAKSRITETGLQEPNRDTLFGSPLSLGREKYLFNLARTKGGIKTPKIHGIHYSRWGDFLMLECMPGISFKAYLFESGFSKGSFLNSLRYLARDFATLHKLSFQSYGALIGPDLIEPTGKLNFADFFIDVLERRIHRCLVKGVFTEKEIEPVYFSLSAQLNSFRDLFDRKGFEPTFVITDMHAENFFVDSNGKPSGYFDIESSLAAPALLEFYGFRFFLFNFYDDDTFNEAEDAFFSEYQKAGGRFPVKTARESQAIDFFAACRLLELSESYWGYIDGIRDSWGERMKTLLLRYMDDAKLDYRSVGEIWRMRDHQPPKPLRS